VRGVPGLDPTGVAALCSTVTPVDSGRSWSLSTSDPSALDETVGAPDPPALDETVGAPDPTFDSKASPLGALFDTTDTSAVEILLLCGPFPAGSGAVRTERGARNTRGLGVA